jgi:hypothetical protein
LPPCDTITASLPTVTAGSVWLEERMVMSPPVAGEEPPERTTPL